MNGELFDDPAKTRVKTQETAVAVTAQVVASPMQLLEMAVEQGAGVDTLERLTALYERMQQQQAHAALVNALNNFQARCPPILKQNPVEIPNGPKYSFASLTDIKVAIQPLLDELGLAVSFSVTDDEKHVTCTIRHRDGATETSQFPIKLDAKMRVNDSQRMASAVTYARRYALTGALGIDTTDDDGLAAGQPPEHSNPTANPNAPTAQPRGERVTSDEVKRAYKQWWDSEGGSGSWEEFCEFCRQVLTMEASVNLNDANNWRVSDLQIINETVGARFDA